MMNISNGLDSLDMTRLKKMAISADKAAKAIKDKRGFVTQAAEQLGITRRHLYRLIDKFPTVKEALEDAREAMNDTAESKIFEKIEAGDVTMLIFYAKTQMKHRGYIERQEITGADGNEVIIKVVYEGIDSKP